MNLDHPMRWGAAFDSSENKGSYLLLNNYSQPYFTKRFNVSFNVGLLQRNLQTLVAEIYKAKNKISPKVINSLFEFTNKNYNLRNVSVLKRKRYSTVDYGIESLVFLAPKIWELVPDSIREVKALSIFKNKIKARTTDKCPCRLCKIWIRVEHKFWFLWKFERSCAAMITTLPRYH